MKKSYFVALFLLGISMSMLHSEVSHLIIAPADFLESAYELADYFEEEYGVEREVHDIDEIISGSDDASEALYDYLEAHFEEPGIQTEGSSVLFIGSGTRDWESGSIRNRIPVYENESVMGIMSDSWFVDFDEDHRVDVAIGRIPASTEDEISGYLDRYFSYLENENSGLWQRKLLFCADDEMKTGQIEGINPTSGMNHSGRSDDMMNSIEDYYLKQQVYGIDYEADESGYKPAARDDIIEIVNEGVNLWCYTGHSAIDMLGDEHYFTEEDIVELNNNGRLPFMFVAGCKTGDFGTEEVCLIEQLMFAGEGGIIGAYASAEYTNPTSNIQMGMTFLSALYNDNSSWGNAMLDAQYNSPASIMNMVKYNILGDPLGYCMTGAADDLVINGEIEMMLPGEELSFEWQCEPSCTEAILAVVNASSYIEYSHTLEDVTYEYNRWCPGNVVYSMINPVAGGWGYAQFTVPEEIVEGDDGRIVCLSESEVGETLSWFSGDIQMGDNNGEEPDIVPAGVIQLSNYPNPFNPVTTIRYYLPEGGNSELSIYNIKGGLVKKLVNGSESEGWHEHLWDGRDQSGRSTSSGIYIIKLASEDRSLSRKISQIK